MPVQTTQKQIYFPDGAMVAVKASGEGSYTDVGAIQSAVTATLNWTENQVEGANWGKSDKQIKEMTIAGGFTLVNLNPEGVERLSGGLFERVTTTDTPVTTNLTNQVIAANWTALTPIEISIINSSTDDDYIASVLTLTSVTGSSSGACTVNDDYMLIKYPGSHSGYAIILSTTGTHTLATSETVTIVFASVTPIISTVIYAGTSTALLSAYAMQITHTDSDSKIRRLELYSVDPNSGGFQFNFKGANEDGLEEMPLTYTAKLDTSLTDGRQLMAWTIETGAA